MDAKKRTITIDEEIKILKLKVRVGTIIYGGRILLIYESIDGDTGNKSEPKQKKLKSPEKGVVKEILIKEGDIVPAGSVLIELEKECNHPTVIRDLCAECGADLQKENAEDGSAISQASFSMVHMVPELKVNDEVAQMLGKADINRLLEERKLVLLVDLDQTLIHTTNDNIPNNINAVYHFQLYGPPSAWYHTRLRPGTHDFLKSISEKYELHICTFGSRKYAHKIAEFLDPEKKYFSHRILSRDECFDPNSKTANLKALFPCGENMVCIIDDREDVWEYASNLIHVKPYHFFQHTGDIHAPPGLTKCENDDDKEGFDFSQLGDSLVVDENSESNETNIKDENLEEKQKSEGNVGEHQADEKIIEMSNETENMETCEMKKENVTNDSNATQDKLINEETTEQNTAEKTNEVSMTNSIENEIVNDAQHDVEIIEKMSNEDKSREIDESSKKPNEIAKNADTESINRQAVTNVGDTIDAVDDQPKPNVHVLPQSKVDAYGFVTIEESDDYLLYLEEILKIIHSEFYARYDETGEIPDLKHVIVETRAKVLKGLSLVFSGIVPNHIRLEDSQAYKVARSLGAKVTQNIEADTTHLVALRAGTHKVHQASKRKTIKLVTPDWLWTCAERWEKVDERLFPLKNAMMNIESRHPPAHCRSPEHPEPLPYAFQTTATATTTTVSGKSNASQTIDFKETINPLMTFSTEDIQFMEGEVEDIFKESDGDTDDTFGEEEEESDRDLELEGKINVEGGDAHLHEEQHRKRSVKKRKYDGDSSSSSSLDEQPNCVGTRNKRIKKRKMGDDDLEDCGESSGTSEDETINMKFRRGENLPSDLDIEYNSDEGTEDDRESDGEWNVMGAALEREFFENE